LFDVIVAVYEDGRLVMCGWSSLSGEEGQELTGAGGWLSVTPGRIYDIRIGGVWGATGQVRVTIKS
jgi:hypothetical protein